MSLKIIETNTIIDSTGKVTFNFPKNTLLDYIYHDIWENIIYYQDYQLFIIGDINKKYDGYHLVTAEEFTKNFIKLFIKTYTKNKGLISMEQIDKNKCLFINGYSLIFWDCEAFLIKKPSNKFVFGTLYSIDKIAISNAKKNIKCMRLGPVRFDNGPNLFVSNELII